MKDGVGFMVYQVEGSIDPSFDDGIHVIEYLVEGAIEPLSSKYFT